MKLSAKCKATLQDSFSADILHLLCLSWTPSIVVLEWHYFPKLWHVFLFFFKFQPIVWLHVNVCIDLKSYFYCSKDSWKASVVSSTVMMSFCLMSLINLPFSIFCFFCHELLLRLAMRWHPFILNCCSNDLWAGSLCSFNCMTFPGICPLSWLVIVTTTSPHSFLCYR